jgi:pSer/pThr/pTyr-binding forkhead associated (FHA) protein
MDRRHCIINVKRGYAGDLTYTIRDNQSVTGTFVMNRILGNRERLLIEDGAIITLGATTLILHTADSEE